MTEHAEEGYEGLGPEDYAIPFIGILQKMSPQLDKKKASDYIEGSDEGMLFNSVTRQLYDGEDGIEIILCYYSREFVEWVPRERGGGFVGRHEPQSDDVKNARRDGPRLYVDRAGDENELIDTRQHFCLILGDNSPERVVIPFKVTDLQESRSWTNRRDMVPNFTDAGGKSRRPPVFAFSWHLSTVHKSNEQGSWYGYKVEGFQSITDMDLLQEAHRFYQANKEGEVQISQPRPDTDPPF